MDRETEINYSKVISEIFNIILLINKKRELKFPLFV